MNSNKFEKLYPRMIKFVKTGSKSYNKTEYPITIYGISWKYILFAFPPKENMGPNIFRGEFLHPFKE